jgi:hypothetical protein
MIPGIVERARQHSRAAQNVPAAAVAIGLPRSVITDAAMSKPTNRCATKQDVVAVSSLGHPPVAVDCDYQRCQGGEQRRDAHRDSDITVAGQPAGAEDEGNDDEAGHQSFPAWRRRRSRPTLTRSPR